MSRLLAAGRDLGFLLARPLLWALLALTLLAAVAAYQVRHAYTVDIGSPGDAPYVRNFHEPFVDTRAGRTFRWSDAYSYVALPGLGGGVPYSLTLRLNPGPAAVPATILINGEPFFQGRLATGWQPYTFAVDATHPAVLASRDLVVELRVPASGVMLDQVQVGTPGPGFVAPAYAQLAYLLACVLLVYLFLARLPRPARPAGRVDIPLGAAAAVAATLVALLALVHLPLTAALGGLAAAGIAAHLVLTLLWPVRAAVAREARIVGHLLAAPALGGLVVLTGIAAVAAYQPRHSYDILVGSPGDQAYMRNFRDRELDPATGRLFRRGGTDSAVVLPGLGGGVPYSVTVTLNPGHPGIPVTANLNGETYLQTALPNGWQSYTFAVDAAHPAALAAPDLVLELRPPPTTELLLARVEVTTGGPGFVVPAASQLVALAGIVLLAYLLLGRALAALPAEPGAPAPGGVPERLAVRRIVPPAGAAVVAALLVGLLAAAHLPLTVATAHLVTAGLLTYGLLLLAEPVARLIVPGAAGGARVAAVLVAAAFLARFGAMALPETVVLDMTYHLKWLHELLAGNWAALTDPHGGLNKPPRRWQVGVFIPKSPLFYMIAAPLAWLPGDLEVVLDVFICLLDASTVLFCYGLLARYAPRLGGRQAGLWAGFAYAANPLAFRELSYGILPTILAQWLTLAFFALLLAWAGSRAGRRASTLMILVLLVLLTAALVAFPTVALFNSLVLVGVALLWAAARDRRAALGVLGLLAGAWVLALASYYAVYVPDLLRTVLPVLLGPAPGAASGAPAASTVHWRDPLDLLDWTYSNLVSAVPLLTGLAGLALAGAAGRRAAGGPGAAEARPERRLLVLALCWVAILPLFLVVNYRVDMIAKHLFYTMVPLALGSGIFFWWLAHRRGPSRLAAGLVAAGLVWTALAFWFAQLVPATL